MLLYFSLVVSVNPVSKPRKVGNSVSKSLFGQKDNLTKGQFEGLLTNDTQYVLDAYVVNSSRYQFDFVQF